MSNRWPHLSIPCADFFENNANLKNFSADSIPFADLSQGLRCLIIKKYRISRNLILSGCQRNGNTMSQRSAFVFVLNSFLVVCHNCGIVGIRQGPSKQCRCRIFEQISSSLEHVIFSIGGLLYSKI